MRNKLLSLGFAFVLGSSFLLGLFASVNSHSLIAPPEALAGERGNESVNAPVAYHNANANNAQPIYLTSTALLEKLDNGNIVEMLPAPGTDMVFDSFYIMPEDDKFTLWLNNKVWGGQGVSVEQWMESQDGLVWENRVNTNLVDNVPNYHVFSGIRQVIKDGELYQGWHNYYYNVVSGMWVRGIRYITSTSGITWTVVNQTVLVSGARFSVLKDAANYEMWVQPHGDGGYTGSRSLRYRTSSAPDSGWGHWQTGGTVVTVDGGEITGGTRVRKKADGTYQLFYRIDNTSDQIHSATSANGFTFTREFTNLLNLRDVLPNFDRLIDFAVVDMGGEDWFYFTYSDPSGDIHIAVSRPEQAVVNLTANDDSPTLIGQTTHLSATLLTGTNVNYAWNFGDGLSGSGSEIDHVYPAVGVYTAVVTASNTNNSLAATTLVTVAPATVFLPVVIHDVCSDASSPVDIILALDTSGSMGGSTGNGDETQLEAAQTAAATFIDLLNFPDDQAGVVSFDDAAYLEQPLTVDAADLHNALQLLTVGGATRIDLAFVASRNELNGPRHNPGNATALILLTDGAPTDVSEAGVLAAAEATKAAGIVVYTIGLGPNVYAGLMQEMASSPSHYYYAPTAAELTAIYEQIADIIHCP